MAKTKLTLIGTGLQSTIELVNANPNLDIASGASVNAHSIQHNIPNTIIRVKGPNHIEVQNNSNLNVLNNDLPLEDIVATSGTIQLNNNYTGNVKAIVQVGNNSIINLTGIELPLGTVTIDQNATFGFTHNNSGMQINTLNNSINTLNLIIKDIHAVVDTANFLNNKFNNAQGFQGNITEGIAARIYEKNKEVVSLFMKQNNMIYEPTKIESYFNQSYLETNGIVHNLNGSDFGNLPIELVGEIFSHADYSHVNLA